MKNQLDIVKAGKKEITMNVQVKKMNEFRIRIWLGLQLIKLAGKILPVKTVIRNEKGK